MDTNEPKNEVELKAWVEDLCRRSRHERGAWDDTIAQLRAQIDGPLASAARHVIEEVARKEPLEFQWRIETMLEETAPPEPPAPEPEEEPEPEPEEEAAPGDSGVVAPLRPEDLVPIYDDPRGLMIHRHNMDARWFLTQVNPMTGQPQTMELSAGQRGQVQEELAGSPYWLEKEWDVEPSPIV